MIHLKKIIFLVMLLFFQSSFASDAVTASDAIAQSKKIKQPEGMISSDAYDISPSTVKEAQSAASSVEKTIVKTGSSTMYCTRVTIPSGTSVTTHNIYVNGVYEDFKSVNYSHTLGISQKINSNSGASVCAFYASGSYRFNYKVVAYPK
jgi:hypothetical protein